MIEVKAPQLEPPKQANWLGRAFDSLAMQISPRWGNRRKAQRDFGNVLHAKRQAIINRLHRGRESHSYVGGAERDRLSDNWLTSRLSPDSGLELNLTTTRERAEGLYRSDTYAHGIVESRVAQEVGPGVRPHSRIRPFSGLISQDQADRLNDIRDRNFQRWNKSGVDRSGEDSFFAVQRLIVRSFANAGEAFCILGLDNTRSYPPLVIDVIDAARVETPPEQLANPKVRLGVEYDSNGRAIAIHVRETHPGDTKDFKFQYRREEIYDSRGYRRVLHVFDRMFPGQSRGLPWLVASMGRLKDMGDVCEAEIIAKQIEASFAAFIKSGTAASPHDIAEGQSSERDASNKRLEEIRPGMIEYIGPEDEITFGDPTRPGTTFAPLIEFSLRSIASGANYPYELLAKNFFRTTFSSGRLAVLDGRLGFRLRTAVAIEKGFQPVTDYLTFIDALSGEYDGIVPLSVFLANRDLFERTHWQTRSFGHVDPQKEINAHVAAEQANHGTISESVAERDSTFEDMLEQRGREKTALIRQDVELRKLLRDLEEQAGLEPVGEGDGEQPAGGNNEDGDSDIDDVAEAVGEMIGVG